MGFASANNPDRKPGELRSHEALGLMNLKLQRPEG